MLSFLDPVCQEPRILWGVRSRSLAFLFPHIQQLRVKSHQPIPAGYVVMDACLLGTWQFRPYLLSVGSAGFVEGR
jgi:hypothetical protein